MNALISLTRPSASPSDPRAVEGVARRERAQAASEVDRAADSPPSRGVPAPNMDEYAHVEPPDSAGLYRLAHDEEGNPKIVFDEPEQVPAAQPPAEDPKSSKTERCTVNTNRVDAEIRQLEKKLAELQQRLARAVDNPQEQAKLQKQVKQVTDELRTKSSDAYKRQHAEYQTTSVDAKT